MKAVWKFREIHWNDVLHGDPSVHCVPCVIGSRTGLWANCGAAGGNNELFAVVQKVASHAKERLRSIGGDVVARVVDQRVETAWDSTRIDAAGLGRDNFISRSEQHKGRRLDFLQRQILRGAVRPDSLRSYQD